MDGLLMVARLLLAVPFATAGLSRLLGPPSARRAAGLRGMPHRLVVLGAILLGSAEVAVAVGLLSGAVAWWAAAAALIFLVLPVGPLSLDLARGSSSPAGLSRIVRNEMLAIPAGLVLWQGRGGAGPDVWSWLANLSTGQWIAVLAGVVLLAVLSGRGAPGVLRPAGAGLPDVPDVPDAAVPSQALPVANAVVSPPRLAATLVRARPELTIGMATYDDFDGVYFTLQALRLYHDLENTDVVVVDNFGCPNTRDLVENWVNGTYILATEVVGTAAPRDLVLRSARGSAVLCCDSHVLFAPGVISRLKQFYRERPGCDDLLQGPLLYDDGKLISTHFDPVWREQMWGTWGTDPRGQDPDGEPFEIPMQGLGAFSCRTDAWPGFNPAFRGFGGEEGYLHEKFRRAGGRSLCLPWFRWMHRFGRPRGTSFPLTVEDKLRNYLIGHAELGLDPAPVCRHFSQYLAPDRVLQVAQAVAVESAVDMELIALNDSLAARKDALTKERH